MFVTITRIYFDFCVRINRLFTSSLARVFSEDFHAPPSGDGFLGLHHFGAIPLLFTSEAVAIKTKPPI